MLAAYLKSGSITYLAAAATSGLVRRVHNMEKRRNRARRERYVSIDWLGDWHIISICYFMIWFRRLVRLAGAQVSVMGSVAA